MLVMPMLFFLRVDAGPPTQWSLSPESKSSRIDTKLVAEIWATSWEEGREGGMAARAGAAGRAREAGGRGIGTWKAQWWGLSILSMTFLRDASKKVQ